MFSAVNTGLRNRSVVPSGRKKYLLSGILACRRCGGSLIVQNSGRYSCYICNNARTKGEAACTNKHRVSRPSVESTVLAQVQETLLSSEVTDNIVAKANEKLRNYCGRSRTNLDELWKQKAKIERRIQHLLNIVEESRDLSSIRTRIELREEEMLLVSAEIDKLERSGGQTPHVTAEWVRSKLMNLKGSIQSDNNKTLMVRNALRNVFRGKLSVLPVRAGGAVEFRISG